MSQLISTRVPDVTAERMRQYARRKQRSLNETFAVAVEEWLRQNEFAYIEFRDTLDGRVAYMKASRLPVWRVVKIAKLYALDVDKTVAYWNGQRAKAWVQAALNYYEVYPDEIDSRIADADAATFEQLKRRIPQLQLVEIEADDNEADKP